MSAEIPFTGPHTLDHIRRIQPNLESLIAVNDAKAEALIPKGIDELFRKIANVRSHMQCLNIYFTLAQSGHTIQETSEQFAISPERIKHIRDNLLTIRELILKNPELDIYASLLEEPWQLLSLLESDPQPSVVTQSAADTAHP